MWSADTVTAKPCRAFSHGFIFRFWYLLFSGNFPPIAISSSSSSSNSITKDRCILSYITNNNSSRSHSSMMKSIYLCCMHLCCAVCVCAQITCQFQFQFDNILLLFQWTTNANLFTPREERERERERGLPLVWFCSALQNSMINVTVVIIRIGFHLMWWCVLLYSYLLTYALLC